MAAYVSNIVIDIGADFSQTFNLESAENSPLNLTGYTASSIMKKHPSSKTTAASFTISFVNRELGKIQISLASSLTNSLRPGRYSYDILLDDGTEKTRIVEGSALVTAGVTTG